MLQLAPSAEQHIRLHAEACYPLECCGVLLGHRLGPSFRVVSALPATSPHTVAERNRYAIDPPELVRFQALALAQNQEILGFYHSHPDHPADWSRDDLAQAYWTDSIYLILAVQAGSCTAMQAFRLTGDSQRTKALQPLAMDAFCVLPLDTPTET